MAIVRETTSTEASGTSTTPTLNKPTGVANTNVLVAVFGVDAGVAISSTPTGWTPLVPGGTVQNPNSTITLAAYYKVITDSGSEPATYDWTISSSAGWVGRVMRYSGVDTANVLDVTSSEESFNTASAFAVDGVTTSTANTMIVSALLQRATAGTALSLTGEIVTEVWESTAIRPLGFADSTLAATGATGTVTWDATQSKQAAGFVGALRASTGTLTPADSDTVTFAESGSVNKVGQPLETFPTLSVEIAFDSDPGDETQTWTDVTDYVRSWSTRRGRQHELDQFQAGTATVVLDNRDRRFDPDFGLQHLLLDGTSGTYASTPDSVPLSITGDIDIRCKVAMDDWTPATQASLVHKRQTTTQLSFGFSVKTDGALEFRWSSTGSVETLDASSVATGFVNDSTHWVRVTMDVNNGSSQREVKFYTSEDGTTWTQLGSTQTGSVASIFDGTASVTIGASQNLGTNNRLAGRIYSVEIRDGIDGTVVADPDFSVTPWVTGDPSGTARSDGTNTWTLNGAAEITGGPYYPNVLPMRRLRIRNTYDGTTSHIFNGFIEGWPQAWAGAHPTSQGDAYVTVTATDAFEVLSKAKVYESAYATEVAKDNPQAWWHLDEGGDNSEGTIDHISGGLLLLAGGPATTNFSDAAELIAGKEDGGGFDTAATTGVGLYGHNVSGGAGVYSEYNGFLGDASAEFTVEAVLQLQANPATADKTVFLQKTPSGTALIHVTIRQADEKVTFAVNTPASGTVSVTSTTALTVGTTHHLACTRDATNGLKIYIDGVDRTSGSGNPTGNATSSSTYYYINWLYTMGTANTTADCFYDEIALYPEALSSTRVAAHAAAVDDAWPSERPGQRVDRILDAIDWPSADRDIDPAGSFRENIDSYIAESDALSLIRMCEDSEGGMFFVKADGTLAFYNGDTGDDAVAVATFGDSTGELGYANLSTGASVSLIRNQISFTSVTQDWTVTVGDTTSKGKYLVRPYAKSGLWRSASVARTNANVLLARYKDPINRVHTMKILPQRDVSNLFPQVLEREIGDKIVVKRRPPGSGTNTVTVLIEGIDHNVSPKRWETTWHLSPAFI